MAMFFRRTRRRSRAPVQLLRRNLATAPRKIGRVAVSAGEAALERIDHWRGRSIGKVEENVRRMPIAFCAASATLGLLASAVCLRSIRR